MRKKYTKHEELSNLRRPTEEEKQQVKVCVEKRLNCVLRTGNTGNFICIVLALIFFTDTVKLKPSWPITLAVFIALLVFMWVVGRGNMHTLLNLAVSGTGELSGSGRKSYKINFI